MTIEDMLAALQGWQRPEDATFADGAPRSIEDRYILAKGRRDEAAALLSGEPERHNPILDRVPVLEKEVSDLQARNAELSRQLAAYSRDEAVATAHRERDVARAAQARAETNLDRLEGMMRLRGARDAVPVVEGGTGDMMGDEGGALAMQWEELQKAGKHAEASAFYRKHQAHLDSYAERQHE